MSKPKIIGTSFSYPHLISLGIDPLLAIQELKKLNLSWVRLGCYWKEVEKSEGKFDSELEEKLLDSAQKLGLKVVLTVGMKAPRWPEYYLPSWLKKKIKLPKEGIFSLGQDFLEKKLTKYLKITIDKFKKYSVIKVWQIENEPLDPSGPYGWRISEEFLKKEAELVRFLDPPRPLLINLWGNELTLRDFYPYVAQIADIVGFDIYFRYFPPLDSEEKIKEIIKSIGKPVWITELQAEPWEPGEIVTKKKNPPSCLPQHISQNYRQVEKWGVEAVFFWGFEWWLYRKLNGDSRWWEEVVKLLQNC